MCIIDTKTYIHPDGRRETLTTTRRCVRASPGQTCARTEYRNKGEAKIVEVKPSTEPTSPSSGSERITARGRVKPSYRDVILETSGSSSKPKKTVRYKDQYLGESSNLKSPVASSSRPSSSVLPPAPSPPLLPTSPYPPALTDESFRVVRPDGSAVYGRPPSLEMPRASDGKNESARPKPALVHRRPSMSSGKANVSRRPSYRDRAPSGISVDTDLPRVGAAPSSSSSPGLSNLPPISSVGGKQYRVETRRPEPEARNDDEYYKRQSARELARQQKQAVRDVELRREEEKYDRQHRTGSKIRSDDTDDYLAAIEKGRLEDSKHDEMRTRREEAEKRQMERERALAEDRRRQREDDETAQLRRDGQEAEALARARLGKLPARRDTEPLTTVRTPVTPTPPTTVSRRPMIHQPAGPLRSIRDRGREVIEREQNRDATQGVNEPSSTVVIADGGEFAEEYRTTTLRRRESRRQKRDEDRRERRREFWQ